MRTQWLGNAAEAWSMEWRYGTLAGARSHDRTRAADALPRISHARMREPFLPPSLLARPIDVCGIENAILDLLLLTDDATVASLGLHKGTMRLVETEEQARILEAVRGLSPEVEAGGSCANVLRVASLAGAVTSYSSAVGRDANGAAF